ncbi:Chemotaxis protein cheY-like protein [Campylobacter jejuni subsp. jejuni M1]|nr:Chemotaxis protein cheY-like protein [Campylobacter jejuni subsp. jejuni M1]
MIIGISSYFFSALTFFTNSKPFISGIFQSVIKTFTSSFLVNKSQASTPCSASKTSSCPSLVRVFLIILLIVELSSTTNNFTISSFQSFYSFILPFLALLIKLKNFKKQHYIIFYLNFYSNIIIFILNRK